MISLENIYQLVENSSHETAFNFGEVEALYNTLITLPEKSLVVEIGVEYGRSTTCIGLIAQEKTFQFIAVDPFNIQDNGQEARAHVEDYLIGELKLPIKLWLNTSEEAAQKFPHKGINLIHIDGDHEYKPVLKDCQLWLPKVKKGGYACFDDYGHDSLPGVYKAVCEYMNAEGVKWQFIGRFGNKLGIFKRVS